MTVTAATVRSGALDPALDAQAHNATQARIIDRPETKVPDSIVEHVDVAMRHLLHAMHQLDVLARSNGLEFNCERTIAGWGDDVVSTLHDLERNGSAPRSGRKLAERLKPILDEIAPPHGTPGLALDARADLITVFRGVPGHVLLAGAVTHHLAARRTRILRGEYARWCDRVGRQAVAA